MTARLRVLLVEDSESDAELAVRVLGKGGYDVSATRVETPDAMRAALDDGPWDVVIADYRLPRFDGPGALRVVQERGLDLPFLVVSGTVGEDVAVGMMKAGAHDYLMKDNLARLAPAVARELREAQTRRERREAEEANAYLLESLAAVNELAIELGGPHGVAELRAILAEKLRAILHAVAVSVSSYDEATGDLVVEHVATPPDAAGIREGLLAALGGRVVGLRMPLSQEMLHRMLALGVARCDGLDEVTFGAMPRPVAATLERLLGIGDLYAMALADDGQMLGACVVAMRRGARPIPEQVRFALTRACSVALRRAVAEEALAASRDYFEGILNAIPDPVFVKDAEHRLVLVNEAECALANRPRSAALGRTDYDFFPREQVDVFRRRDEEVLRTGRESLSEEEITDARTGELRTILTKKSRYVSPSGAFVVGVVRDITERKRAEEELRRSEARFATIFHASPQAVTLARRKDAVLLDVNEAWCRMSGFSREEAIGRTSVELQLWADPRERERLVEALSAQGASQGVEIRLRSKSGDVGDTLLSAILVDVSGEGCVLSMAVDISARKRAEEALRLQEERLRLAVEGAALGTWHWDVGSGRLLWSDRTCAMFGVPPGSPCTHEAFLRSVHPDDREVVAAALRAARGGAPYEVEFRTRWPDGSERWIASSGRTYLDEGGAPLRVEGVARDVTEQKRLEAELRQAQKMEAVGRLAGGVAHDFNNLLGVITGYSEMALRQLDEGHPVRGRIEQVLRAAERASQLTRQLLAFSRRQVLAPKVVDLNTLLADFEKMLRRVIGEDVELVFRPGAGPEAVRVDPGQLEQAVMNLVVNARDAMPRGGTLTVETADVELARPIATSLGQPVAPGRYSVLTVTDTGQGIEPANLARIFEPFFTTKPLGEGTGLGLASVYGMVTQSGGHVDVSSRFGCGTRFTIYLPRVSEEVSASPEAASEAESLRGDETVLVVEDQEVLREVVRETLAELGYSLLVADGAEEALAIAERHGGPIHLLLTDVVMPRVSGPELARRFVGARPEAKVLFVSGYPDEVLARQGLPPAGHALREKPVTRPRRARAGRAALGPARPLLPASA
jgi:two-component system cell cycle sensor histidine kinase/response regulator CckA